MTCLLLSCAFLAQAQPVFAGELIFPPNPKHNHGSSIVETPEGDLLAVWFHGSGERKSDDVLLQGARKRNGEDAWCAPFVMADTPGLPDCNPVLFIDPQKTLWLFWVTVQDNQWGGTLLKYRTATNYDADGPPQWDWQDVIHTRPVDLETQFLGVIARVEENMAPLLASVPRLPELIAVGKDAATTKLKRRLGWMTRIHPIMTSEKRLMLGLYSDVFNCSLAAFTEDAGATWFFSEPILDPQAKRLGNIQPSFVMRKNGDIVAYMRDNGIPNRVRTATSTDHGITWPSVQMLAIPNPGSSVECIALESGRWVLVCNDTNSGRHRLSAYVSEDEGATWPTARPIEEREEKKDGSFSYPSLIQASDGTMHSTYSYRSSESEGSSIKHAHFNEAWLLARED